MTPEDVVAHLATVLADIAPDVDLSRVDRRENLREALDIDSMDHLRMLQGLHAATGVDVPESDYPKVASLEALAAYVASRAR